jgi:hypothetical protein
VSVFPRNHHHHHRRHRHRRYHHRVRLCACVPVCLCAGEISWGAASFVGLPLIGVVVANTGPGALFWGNAVGFTIVGAAFYFQMFRSKDAVTRRRAGGGAGGGAGGCAPTTVVVPTTGDPPSLLAATSQAAIDTESIVPPQAGPGAAAPSAVAGVGSVAAVGVAAVVPASVAPKPSPVQLLVRSKKAWLAVGVLVSCITSLSLLFNNYGAYQGVSLLPRVQPTLCGARRLVGLNDNS